MAHIDHGKSTLADRFISLSTNKKLESTQVLDKLSVEQERGITIKSQTVSLITTYKNQQYLLNLIDTPGHSDFQYEVTKTLLSSESAILLIDATKGIQAQTIANYNLAKKYNLEILVVLNKIDMPYA